MAPPAPAIAPKTPNARARSFGMVKVVVSTASAVGASSAPNAPCSARAPTSSSKRAGGAAERGGDGEADEADDEGALAAEQVGEAAAEQQQAAEGERVGGDDPLAVAVGEAEVGLGGRQRDVHDGRVEHDHELGEPDDGEGQPATAVGRAAVVAGDEDMRPLIYGTDRVPDLFGSGINCR